MSGEVDPDPCLEAAVFLALVEGLEFLQVPRPDATTVRARLDALLAVDRGVGHRSVSAMTGGRGWLAFFRLATAAQPDKASLMAMHRILMPGHPGAGRLRPPGRCVVRCPSTGLVIHTPPPAAQVPAGLARMLARAHPDPESPLWPFDAFLELLILHPLTDGNGRVARLFTAALCWRHGLREPQWVHALGGLYRHQGQAIRAGSMERVAGRGRRNWLASCRQAMDEAQAWWSNARSPWRQWWTPTGDPRLPSVLPPGCMSPWAG